MRLNRGSFIFLAIMIVVIVFSSVFLFTDFGAVPTATPQTASTTFRIFPNAAAANVTALSISSNLELADTRPTPIPGNPPLPTVTPLPEGEEAPTENKTIALQYDSAGIWVLGEGSTVTGATSLVQQTVTTALNTLVSLQTSQQFTPSDGNYAQYGLDTPTHDIRFVVEFPASTDVSGQTSSTPPESHRLRLGNRSVDNSQYFAFLDDDSTTVYVISSAAVVDSNVLRLVSQPPFTPPPTATPQAFLNVQLPFGTFNLNLAASVALSDNQTGTSVVFVKAADNFTWTIENADPSRQVDSVRIPIYLTEFGNINGVSQTTVADLSTVGLDNPHYTFVATMGDGTIHTLQLGNTDPTGTLYYSLVNDFSEVVLIQGGTIAPFLQLLENPPYIVEVTPEVTAEMTASAMEATAEMTPEVTAEATQAAGN